MELGLVISSLIIGSLALFFSMVSIIMMISKERATHTVQLMPVDEEIDRANEAYLKKWSSSEENIKKQNEIHREEVEDEMPEFSLTDDDKEIFSI